MALLNIKQAAEYLGCSRHTLDRARENGTGPGFNKRLGRVLYDTADLDRWFSEGWQNSTSDTPGRRVRRLRRGSVLEQNK